MQQQRATTRRAVPTILFLALAIWVGAVFMIVGHQPVKQPHTTTVHQAVTH
jgi:hypothetical protein